MKLAFISDIHGNAVALEAVLDDIQKKNINSVYVLGDIAFRGPEPKKCIQLVQSLNTGVIKGNADEWVVRGIHRGEVPDGALEIMNQERDWIASKLDEEDTGYLEGLPKEMKLELDGLSIHAFHATPDSLFEVVPPSAEDTVLETKLMKTPADLYIYAHIHKPYIKFLNGKVVMNIGSVGLPFDGLRKASYGIVECHEGRLRTSIERVPYDYEEVIGQYKDLQYPNEKMADVIRDAKI